MTSKFPQFEELQPGIKPLEFNVLLFQEPVEEKTKGGIIMPSQVRDVEQRATTKAILVSASPHAFTYADWPSDQEPPKAGDIVLTGRFVGSQVQGADGREYTMCKDKDISGVFQ